MTTHNATGHLPALAGQGQRHPYAREPMPKPLKLRRYRDRFVLDGHCPPRLSRKILDVVPRTKRQMTPNGWHIWPPAHLLVAPLLTAHRAETQRDLEDERARDGGVR